MKTKGTTVATVSSTSTSTSTSATQTVVQSTAATILSSLGTGSDIDVSALATSLTTATFSAAERTLATKESGNTARISALATIKSNLDSFSGALKSLVSGGTLATTPTSSDSSVLGVAAIAGTHAGAISAQIEVQQLARAQSISSASVSDATAAVGLGKLTLKTSTRTVDVEIKSTNNSLNGLAAAINAAGANVTASVVKTGSGYQLVVKGATGSGEGFSLVPASDASAGLSAYKYDPEAAAAMAADPDATAEDIAAARGGMTLAQAAQDATLVMDGVTITRSSNTIGDLIGGVKLTLNKAEAGSSVTLGATRPTEAITRAVTDFVDTYNALKAAIDETTIASSSSADAGVFYGNSAIRSMQASLARLTSTSLTSYGRYSTLAEIGVQTARDGSLSVDSTKLAAALAADPDGVEAMFNPGQWTSSSLIQITSTYGATAAGTYKISGTAATGTAGASATIDGRETLSSGTRIAAKYGTAAYGLSFKLLGDVTDATIGVDLGISGALAALVSAFEADSGLLGTMETRLETEGDRLADDRTALDDRKTAYQARMNSQLTKMQTAVSSYKSIQSYLDQQVAIWTNSDR